MIHYRRLNLEDKEQFVKLMDGIIDGLDVKEFFIRPSDEKVNYILDGDLGVSFGAFDKDKMIATAYILFNDSVDFLRDAANVGENSSKFGGFLVAEEYRNMGIIKELEKILITEAKVLDLDNLVIMVHPDNIPSIKVIEYTGAEEVNNIIVEGYPRKIYLLKIK